MLDAFFQDFPIPLVTLGGVLILGLISGVVGSFAVLNKQGLLGEGISHASLPGICIMFLFMGSKEISMLLLGAALASLLAMLCIFNISKYTRVKFDAALALMLASFYGMGIVLKSYIQTTGNAKQAGLDEYIFGQVNLILREDLISMSICAVIILLLILVYWKQLIVFIFDADYARCLGFSSKCFHVVLSILITLTVVIGLKTVGVILMCALLVAPGVAARQWTDKISTMVILSAIFAMSAGFIGTYIGSVTQKMPSGPLITVSISLIVLFSLLLAPKRGILFKMWQRKNNQVRFKNRKLNDVPD